MSSMDFMEKLLDGVEVEWKALAEVAEYSKTRISFDFLDEKNYVGVDNLLQNRAGKTESNYLPTEGNFTEYCSSDILIGNIRPYLRKIWHADRVGGTNGDVLVIHPTDKVINPGYLYQVLTDEKFFGYNMQHAKGAKMPRGNKAKIMEYSIPIPCPNNQKKSLEIQTEIVRILDTFTELTTELTTELSARKKQYNYYRDQLLSFEEGEVEWKTLGEVGKFTYGLTAKAQESGNARFIRISDVNSNGKLIASNSKYVDISEGNRKYILKKNDLLMARTGATFGKTMLFDEDYPAIYAGFLIKLSFDESIINPKYYWHFAQSYLFWDQANKLVSGGGQPQFNANVLKVVNIPIPYPNNSKKSLAEQERIVTILDKFDTIVSSISEGLPREIELRQKQYAYYRDLLLSFPKPEELKLTAGA